MNIFITLVAVIVGIFIIFWVTRATKNKQMNEIYALVWIIGGVGIIILGIQPHILNWFAELLGIFWPPSVLIFFLLVLVFLMLFNHSKTASTLTNQVTELTIQVSLLKSENEKLKEKISNKYDDFDNLLDDDILD